MPAHSTAGAIAAAARQVSHTIGAQAIVAFATGGGTALGLSREPPDGPALGLTPSLTVARRPAVVWGVHAVVVPEVHSMSEAATRAGEWRDPSATNALRVTTVR